MPLGEHGPARFRSAYGGNSEAEPGSIPISLTPRELEVVELVASGATNDEIAVKLFVSRATVAKHLENILQKLDCPNRTAAAHKALVHHLRALPSW